MLKLDAAERFLPFLPQTQRHRLNRAKVYVWSSVADATVTVMQIRYSLLPYFYTLFHQAHTAGETL